MLVEKDIKKKGSGSFDYHKEENRKIIVVKRFDNKAATLASSYVGIESADAVKHYDRSISHVHVSRPNIVRLYNQYMGGIDKLDIMCSLYKPNLRFKYTTEDDIFTFGFTHS